MKPRQESKCDCQKYDTLSDHHSSLIKMDLPEFEDGHYGGTSHAIIFRALRLVFYVVTFLLLAYCLWRIRIIDSTLLANERLDNAIKSISLDKHNLYVRRRLERSVESGEPADRRNSFVPGESKGSPREATIASKYDDGPRAPGRVRAKSPRDEEFEQLVKSLLDKIEAMHEDDDRSHFDNNMRAVFRAWFPVFDALLPSEMTDGAEARKSRSEFLPKSRN